MSNRKKVNKLSKEVASKLKKLFKKVKPELIIEDDSDTSIRFGYICNNPKKENWKVKAQDILDNLHFKLLVSLGVSDDHYWEDYVGPATNNAKNKYLIEGVITFGKVRFE